MKFHRSELQAMQTAVREIRKMGMDNLAFRPPISAFRYEPEAMWPISESANRVDMRSLEMKLEQVVRDQVARGDEFFWLSKYGAVNMQDIKKGGECMSVGKFKVGDICEPSVTGCSALSDGGKYIQITEIDGSMYRYVGLDEDFKPTGERCYGCLYDENLTLVKRKSIMKTLSNMMKRLLDSDTQALVKAGFINGDLKITPEGQDALNSILFMNNKEELVLLAKAEIEAKLEEEA